MNELRKIYSDLREDGKGWILLAVSAGWFLSIGVRYIYPTILPYLREAFSMDLTVAGFLLSGLWLAYALGQFPGGVLGDQIGEGKILVVSTILSSIAILSVTLSMNLFMMFISTIAFGFATGLYGPHRFTIFTDVYSHRSGSAVGLTMAAGNVGNTVLPILAVGIAGFATWRLGFGVLIPLFIAISMLIYLVVPARTSNKITDSETSPLKILRQIIASTNNKGILIIVMVHILLAFVSNGFLGFFPIYLVEVKGISAQNAALLYSSYFALSIVIQPLTGVARDKFGSQLTLTFISLMLFLGLIGLQIGDSIIYIALLMIFISHRNGVGVITNTYIAERLSDDIKGSGLGLLRTSWTLIGALSPIFVGFLGDIGHLSIAFLILGGITAIATLLTLLVDE